MGKRSRYSMQRKNSSKKIIRDIQSTGGNKEIHISRVRCVSEVKT